MSVDHEWTAENGLLVRFSGVYDMPSLMEHASFLFAGGPNEVRRIPLIPYVIVDYHDISSITLTEEELIHFTHTEHDILKMYEQLVEPVKLAIVTTHETIIRYLDIFLSNNMRDHFNCKIFENFGDAEDWARSFRSPAG